MLESLFYLPTLYTTAGASCIAMAVLIAWMRRDHKESGWALPMLACSSLCVGLAFVGFGLRYADPTSVPPSLPYVGFALSVVLFWAGVGRLMGGRPRPFTAVVSTLGFVALFAAINSPDPAHASLRLSLSGAFSVVFLLLAAREIHRSPWIRQIRAVRTTRATVLVYCALILVQLVPFLLRDPTLDRLPPGPGSSGFVLLLSLLPVALMVQVLSVMNSQLRLELHRMATTDELTGLMARRSLQVAAEQLLGRAGPGPLTAMLMIDVDDFKAVNDRYGHAVGDDVLKHVAVLLREHLRPDSLIVRYGGDEFCALVTVPSESAAFLVSERLRAAVAATPTQLPGGECVLVTLSIGVKLYRKGMSLSELLDEADRGAYRAKRAGRNRVVSAERDSGEPPADDRGPRARG